MALSGIISESHNRGVGERCGRVMCTADVGGIAQATQQPELLTEHGGSQSAAPATNSARQETSEYSNHNGGTDRRPPATTADNRRQPQTTQQPEPLTEHGGSQSAAPATNSARQETSEYSITMEGRTGDHRRQDNATARASNGAWRFTKCCACHEFCTWRFTKCCACHEFCT